MTYQAGKKNRQTALILSLFLGTFGVDRFYLGQTLPGVLKLLTFGACGVWTFLDWFLIMGSADRMNMDSLRHLRAAYPTALPPGPP